MSRIQKYEWLCLRAIKPHQRRCYSTAETSTTTPDPAEEPLTNLEIPSQPQSNNETQDPTRPQLTHTQLRTFLTKQDTIHLNKLQLHLQQLQNTNTLASQTLLAYRHAASTVALYPPGKVPPYTITNSTTAKNIENTHIATARLAARTQTVLDNLEDLQMTLYPFERGASAAEKYKEDVSGMGWKKKKWERERAGNLVDGNRKRFEQKVGALKGMVDEMRRSLGLEAKKVQMPFEMARARSPAVTKVWEGERKGIDREREDAGDAVSTGDATVGTAKVEAEAEAVNPPVASSPSQEASTGVGTAKVEAEAEEAASKPTATSTTSSYTPMSSEPDSTEQQLPMQAASSTPTTTKQDPIPKVGHKTAFKRFKFPNPASSNSPISKLEKLLKSLTERGETTTQTSATSTSKVKPAGSGQSSTKIEEPRFFDDTLKRANPFAMAARMIKGQTTETEKAGESGVGSQMVDAMGSAEAPESSEKEEKEKSVASPTTIVDGTPSSSSTKTEDESSAGQQAAEATSPPSTEKKTFTLAEQQKMLEAQIKSKS